MDKLYMRRIETNVKKKMAYDLDQKVLILGANGAGKSALIDSYSLLITGTAHTAGIGKGREIVNSGSADGLPVLVEGHLSDGEVISWTGKNAEAAGEGIHEAVLDALYGDGTGLQKLIMRSVALPMGTPGGTWRDVIMTKAREHVPEAHMQRLRALLDETKATSVSTGIIESIEAANARIRYLGAIAKSAKNEKLREQVSEEDELEFQLYANFSRTYGSTNVPGIFEKLSAEGKEHLQASAESAKALAEAKARLTELEAATGRDALAQGALDSLLTAYGPMLQLYEEKAGGALVPCLCCGGKVEVATLRERREKLSGVLGQLQGKLLEVDKARTRVDALLAMTRDRSAAAAQIRADLTRFVPLYKKNLSADEHAKRFELLESAIAELKTAVFVEETLSDMTKEKEREESVRAGLLQIQSDISGLMLSTASARANRLLPNDMRVEFEHFGQWNRACRCNVLVGGKKTTFRLCGGAERALVTAALSSAFTQPKSDMVTSLIIDDVWLSRPRVTNLLQLVDRAMLADAGPSQAIISVVEYEGTIPEDWTVIRLGQDEAKATKEPKQEKAAPPPPSDDDFALTSPEATTPPPPSDDDEVGGVGDGGFYDLEEPLFDALDGEGAAETTGGGADEGDDGDDEAGPEQLGVLARAAGTVPVYWLGRFGRFTAAGKQVLTEVEDKVEGMLGVALSGQKDTLKPVVYMRGSVFEATLTADEKDVLRAMIGER